jgi:hypothetical protein
MKFSITLLATFFAVAASAASIGKQAEQLRFDLLGNPDDQCPDLKVR